LTGANDESPEQVTARGFFMGRAKGRLDRQELAGLETAKGEVGKVQGGRAQHAQAADDKDATLQRAQSPFSLGLQAAGSDQGYAG
jgi:hypothetical protein